LAHNGNGVSRAQGLPTNQDDDHVKYHSQKARVFGVGWNPLVRPVRSKLYHQTVQRMSGKVARSLTA
jgi:hypothetical protein